MRCLSNTTDSCRNDAYHASGLLDKATSMVHADARVSAREIKKFGFFCFILRFFLIKFKGFNLCRNNAWHDKRKNVVCICICGRLNIKGLTQNENCKYCPIFHSMSV